MQTVDAIRELERERTALGTRVAGVQNRRRELSQALGRANREANRWNSELHLARVTDKSSSYISDVRQRADEAALDRDHVSRQLTGVDEELEQAYGRLSVLSTQHRIALALGVRELPRRPVPVPEPPPELLAKRETRRLVSDKREAARRDREALAGAMSAAAAHAAATRVDFHLGKVKDADKARADKAETDAAAALALADRTLSEMSEALERIVRECEAAESTWRDTWRPALEAEHARRVQVFADALRAAAIASEELAVTVKALGGTGGAVFWHELLVSDLNSKFSLWIAEAIAGGQVK